MLKAEPVDSPVRALCLKGLVGGLILDRGRSMFFRMVLFVWEFVLDLVAVIRMGENEKDLQILLLRQQLRIVERKQERGPQIPRWQKRRRQRDSIDGAHTATFFTAKHVADKLLENLSQAS